MILKIQFCLSNMLNIQNSYYLRIALGCPSPTPYSCLFLMQFELYIHIKQYHHSIIIKCNNWILYRVFHLNLNVFFFLSNIYILQKSNIFVHSYILRFLLWYTPYIYKCCWTMGPENVESALISILPTVGNFTVGIW